MSEQAADGSGEGASHEERLRRMRRPADYPFTLLVFNPINRRLVRGLTAAGVRPNLLTALSLLTALGCALCIWQAIAHPSAPLWAAGAILLGLVSGWLDTLDGDLARYADRGSRRGGALDMVSDRLVEVLFLAAAGGALALHAAPTHAPWWTAAAVAAVLLYFYTADAVVRLILESGVHDRKRYTMTRDTAGGRMRLGLYEPFRLGFPVVASVGLALPALQATAIVFGLALCGQLLKILKAT